MKAQTGYLIAIAAGIGLFVLWQNQKTDAPKVQPLTSGGNLDAMANNFSSSIRNAFAPMAASLGTSASRTDAAGLVQDAAAVDGFKFWNGWTYHNNGDATDPSGRRLRKNAENFWEQV